MHFHKMVYMATPSTRIPAPGVMDFKSLPFLGQYNYILGLSYLGQGIEKKIF